jgi:low affinity Fe/Cu permease
MKKIYRQVERIFETVALTAIAVLGNSITFIVALLTVIFWLANKPLFSQDIHSSIGDIILGVTFLSLFIIQKSFNRFSASLHLKVNELVSSHEPASNEVIHVGNRTEHEIAQFSKDSLHSVSDVQTPDSYLKPPFTQALRTKLRRRDVSKGGHLNK